MIGASVTTEEPSLSIYKSNNNQAREQTRRDSPASNKTPHELTLYEGDTLPSGDPSQLAMDHRNRREWITFWPPPKWPSATRFIA